MYKQLTSEQRYTISVLLQKKFSLSFIVETIGVSVSTVSRERRRNSNAKGVYDARTAVLKVKRHKARTPGICRGATHTGERSACKVDNDRQRAGVCRTRNHCEGT
jgi:IS30 family transposase